MLYLLAAANRRQAPQQRLSLLQPLHTFDGTVKRSPTKPIIMAVKESNRARRA